MGDFNEEDKAQITFVTTGSNVTTQASHNETINFVVHERQSKPAYNEDDEAGYFDLYFAMNKDVNHQVEDRSLQKESLSTSSSISNFVGRNYTAYHNPYVPLQEYSQEDPYACEVTVTVHQGIECSSWSDEDAPSHIYSNVCIPLRKDRLMNSQANESQLSSDRNIVHESTLPAIILPVFRTVYLQDCKYKSTNEGVILEPIEPSSYIGVYDEVDENPLTFDTTDLKVTSQESHFETIDCDSYERLSIIASTEHGDTGYLDPYFAMEEDENHQLQDRTSQTECSSTNSSNSDVVDQDNIAYNNLYQPLQEDWQDDSHGYEVPVMVHKCFENSAGFDEHATSHSYYNVYKPLQKDWDIKSPTYENQKFQETKAGNDKRLLADDFSSELKTGNLHEYINMVAESNISIEICDNCHAMESCKTFDQDKSKTIEQKSC
ncbi:unnamed protein product [Mytilus coruscus]|uniref:Uncharacterized protein n=1 Tax=Mytilus coruscus TaxID=42192 RepID=A0A6J8D9Y1_MYTCO|nr:unnamed protein product [Mytilus coruscus]